MRTLWRGLVRVVFWSFERGTLPYDVAVVIIVLFVMFSPRTWFNDRPRSEALTASAIRPATVERYGSDPIDGAVIYRVDARLVSGAQMVEQQLHDAVRKHAQVAQSGSDFEILRYNPVPGRDGAIAYYDVCIKPSEIR